jgi:CRP/FNR family cyclic AMP-dependent transcriptional regulator
MDVPVKESRDKSIVSYFSEGAVMHFTKEQTIMHGFNQPDGVYLIKEGFVKAYSVSDAGLGNLLLIHAAGEIIPLPWALDGMNVTGLSYEAMGDVTIIKSSKYKLREAMGRNQWLSEEILSQTVDLIALYTQRIQTLEFRSARGRIIAEIIHLQERFGRHQGAKIIIDVPVTHQDIADSINMSRETASRALELLFEEGLVGQDDHMFTVPDSDKLKRALS